VRCIAVIRDGKAKDSNGSQSNSQEPDFDDWKLTHKESGIEAAVQG
jgi:hypothetical protein